MDTFWTDQAHQTLVDMASKNASAREIAQALGTTRNAILGRAFRHGVKLSPPVAIATPKAPKVKRQRRWTQTPADLVCKARQLYVDGKSLAEISADTEIPVGTLPSFFKDLPRRREGVRSKPKDMRLRLEVLALHYAGFSEAKAAKRMGVSQGSLRNWKRDRDLRAKAMLIGSEIKMERARAAAEKSEAAVAERRAYLSKIAAHNAPILASLKPRHREIMMMQLAGANLAQAGKAFGISRERVRQIQVACRMRGLIIPDAKPLSAPSIRLAKTQSGKGRGAPGEKRKPYNLTLEDRRRRAERMRAVAVKRWYGEASA